MKNQIETAVIIESFRKDIEYIKAQLTILVQNQKDFVLKSELDEAKKDFNDTIKRIETAQAQHNKDDIESFGGLKKNVESTRNWIVMAMGGVAVLSFIIQLIAPFVISKLWG